MNHSSQVIQEENIDRDSVHDFENAKENESISDLKETQILKSKRFYSEEKYHYLDNKDKIESELKEFKLDIEWKFKNAETWEFKFKWVSYEDSFEISK